MLKKIFLLFLLLFLHQDTLFCMEKEIQVNYYGFFRACDKVDFYAMTRFIAENPKFDINYQDDTGTTALLVAAKNYEIWDVVWYLLAMGADKTIKNNVGQSLFSIAIYSRQNYGGNKLPLVLPFYHSEQINIECKTMGLCRYSTLHPTFEVSQHVTDVLERKKRLESRNDKKETALFLACTYFHVPLIIQLLKRKADLNLNSKSEFPQYSTPYAALQNNYFYRSDNIFFVLREAFNNGPAMPASAALIHKALKKRKFLPDIAKIIKQFYVQTVAKSPLSAHELKRPEAQFWNPVCIQACKIAGFKEATQDTCLRRILLLPQKEKTELNVKLLKNQEEHAQKSSFKNAS